MIDVQKALMKQNIITTKLSDSPVKKSENFSKSGSPLTENQTLTSSSESSEGKEEVTEENLSNINKDINSVKSKTSSSKRRNTISVGDGSDFKSLLNNSPG